jgi:hypothetical protein
VIALPPLDAGAENVKVTADVFAEPELNVGAPGIVLGITALEGSEYNP